MSLRGRKSKSSQQALEKAIAEMPRPVAPSNLTRRQRREWDDIVSRLPPDWFPAECHAVLIAYCRHVERAETLGAMLDALALQLQASRNEETFNSLFKRWEMVSKAAAREVSSLVSCGRALRITPQSRHHHTAGVKARVQPPMPHES